MGITIKSNIKLVTAKIADRLKKLENKEYLLRPVAFDVIDLMTDRIHNKGMDSSDSPIGTYSSDYLRERQIKYKRDGDPKVVVSLTRQLENDWSVIATQKGYGIGFLNQFNLQKARWVEEGKGKKIFNLSKPEQTFVVERINGLADEAINKE